MTKLKIYLAHPLSTTAEFEDSKRVANRLREQGFEVFVASENLNINDKSRNPTPKDIYDADISELLSSDIVVANISATLYDGTILEIGAVAGFNENIRELGRSLGETPIPIIGYTSNARLLQPQFYKGVPSASANHLVLGAVAKWGEFVGNEDSMIEKAKEHLDTK